MKTQTKTKIFGRLATIGIALAVFAASPAMSQLKTLIKAVEVSTVDMIVPTASNGRLLYKACAGACSNDHESVRLTPNTQFVFNGTGVNFIDFRAGFYNQRFDAKGYALISFDTENRIATQVVVEFGN